MHMELLWLLFYLILCILSATWNLQHLRETDMGLLLHKRHKRS